MALVLRDVELDGRLRADVALSAGGRVAAVGELRPAPGDTVIDGDGGALVPGLTDRHLHLMAFAASLESVACGPPATRTAEDLAGALRARALEARAPGRRPWIRGVGYHESVAGPLDRHRLDSIVGDLPVRVQHRSGALWTVNSAGADLLGLDGEDGPDAPGGPPPAGVERDPDGRATGRLWRADSWLRERLGPARPPDLARVGRLLASYGITAVTDATPGLPDSTVVELAAAAHDGRLPQRLTLLGAEREAARATGDSPGTDTVRAAEGHWVRGPYKLQPPDHAPWPYDELLGRIRAARGTNRWPVAVHCVTREALVTTLVALQEAGPVPGDRIEHASVVPPELLPLLRELAVRVVTQPVFVAERGDAYLADVDPADLPHLYPYASLLAAGVPVFPSSDAPYGSADPWAGVRAARDRRTPGGRILNPAERVGAEEVLRALLTRPSVRPGGPADLCLLRTSWREATNTPEAGLVRLTLRQGRVIHGPAAD
jgi:predicted amidohydrolase YtcJ